MSRPPAPQIPLAADEATTLNAFLDFYRAALLDRAFELDDEQLRIALAPSALTIGRLLGHMAWVEDYWFREIFNGGEPHLGWPGFEWPNDPDAEMSRADTLTGDELRAEFEGACADSNTMIAAAPSFDQLSVTTNRDGEQWNLRWIGVHMIEEYARHCGHADLIRESIDGDIVS